MLSSCSNETISQWHSNHNCYLHKTHTHTIICTLSKHTLLSTARLEIFKKTKAPCGNGAAVISATRRSCRDEVILRAVEQQRSQQSPRQTALSPCAITSRTFPMEWFPLTVELLRPWRAFIRSVQQRAPKQCAGSEA